MPSERERNGDEQLPLGIERMINAYACRKEGEADFTNCYRLAARRVLEAGGTRSDAELAIRETHARIRRLCPPFEGKRIPGTKGAYDDDKLEWNFSPEDEDNHDCYPRSFLQPGTLGDDGR